MAVGAVAIEGNRFRQPIPGIARQRFVSPRSSGRLPESAPSEENESLYVSSALAASRVTSTLTRKACLPSP